MEWTLLLAGAAVGGLVGATGLGGAALMTPLLSLGFGVPLSVAVSTDLLFAAATKSVAAGRYAHQRHTQWRWVGWLALGSLPAALVSGMVLAPRVGDQWLGVLLGMALLTIAVAPTWNRPPSSQVRPLRLLLAGALIGTLVSLTSVGAGVLGTLALVMWAPALGGAALVGTELAHALLLSVVASATHLGMDRVDYELLWPLLLGGVPAAYIGAKLGPRVSLDWIKLLARILMGGAGLRMIIG
ncbi:sulfite exporter TauE/SafE family protein [Litorivicinus lipolyticus]|uniref:sulfite exporter TauE/SafE family protein n=1 Tax=Litorivicinus lipolyticus TaxID=418701 RepID=UPI003B58C9C2